MLYCNVTGALKDFDKPQGAESSPQKHAKVGLFYSKVYKCNNEFCFVCFREIFNVLQMQYVRTFKFVMKRGWLQLMYLV